MTLTELRYIVALAQEQHFGRAAERCHVSQPTLVHRGQEARGRARRAVRARQAEDPADAARREDRGHGAPRCSSRRRPSRTSRTPTRISSKGPIALGTLPTIGPYLLPQFIPLLQETSSKLSLYVEEGSVTELATKLRNGDLDAILVTAPFVEADVVVQPLFDEPFVLLLPADHRLANKVQDRGGGPRCPRSCCC